MIKAIRGTRDLLPPDTDLWNRVEAKVRDVFARYNFHEIRTPIFEDTSLFARGVGEFALGQVMRAEFLSRRRSAFAVGAMTRGAISNI